MFQIVYHKYFYTLRKMKRSVSFFWVQRSLPVNQLTTCITSFMVFVTAVWACQPSLMKYVFLDKKMVWLFYFLVEKMVLLLVKENGVADEVPKANVGLFGFQELACGMGFKIFIEPKQIGNFYLRIHTFLFTHTSMQNLVLHIYFFEHIHGAKLL